MNTREDCFTDSISRILYGIAILLMVAEHLFFSGGRFTGYISLYTFSNGVTVEKLFAEYISCVSIYSFVSGYGLRKKFDKDFSGGGGIGIVSINGFLL